MDALRHFREVWAVDFEFTAPSGNRPTPLCVVAREFRSGRLVREWLDERSECPYPTDEGVLFVAYYASAELGCHLAQGWKMPARILDLYAEFACLTSGLRPPNGRGLLGALIFHGLPAMDAVEKSEMRELAMRGGHYSEDERTTLIDYCQSDVDSLARLLPAMLPKIDLPRALLRGRYMAAAARMEWRGVPIDAGTLVRLHDNWNAIKGRLTLAIDAKYQVYVPVGGNSETPRFGAAVAEGESDAHGPQDTCPHITQTDQMVPSQRSSPPSALRFSAAKWREYLLRVGIAWPQLDSGALALDDDTFKEMAKLHPAEVGPIRQLRQTLGQMRLNELSVGQDNRNRTLLSAFGSKTGRNQPSNAKFIFGPSCWLRSLIQPGPGHAVAYVDWSAQELGIAAALSEDSRMKDAYSSGDPYLWFGKFAKLVPTDATKLTHGEDRDRLKVVMLGVLYGLSETGIAQRLGISPAHGRELLQLHRETFRRFWSWLDRAQDYAMLSGRLQTAFGWCVHVDADTTPTSLRNFPMQAHGAEMMRFAACLATERGIGVCCPVHDAFLIESEEERIEAETVRMQEAMCEASELVLPGFPLRTEAKIFRHPERYSDPRGEAMWREVLRILAELDEE